MAEGTQHPITDAGRRMSEAVAKARQAGGMGRWIAVAMADGSWNGDIYDSKADAIRHADESRHAYVMVPPMPMPPAEATAWIDLHRRLFDSGWRMTDPDQPVPVPALGATPGPRSGRRPSGLVIPDRTLRTPRRHR